jgi:hypothetical protein
MGQTVSVARSFLLQTSRFVGKAPLARHRLAYHEVPFSFLPPQAACEKRRANASAGMQLDVPVFQHADLVVSEAET